MCPDSDHNPSTSQTDGRTDDCDRKTALCTKEHRAVKRESEREREREREREIVWSSLDTRYYRVGQLK